MAHALPIHIIYEIERRWQRRLDARAEPGPGKNIDRSAGHCPLCCAPALIEPVTPMNAFSIGDRVCSACGHVWRNGAL